MGYWQKVGQIKNARTERDVAALFVTIVVIPRLAAGFWLDPVPAIIGLVLEAAVVLGPHFCGQSIYKRIRAQFGVGAVIGLLWCWGFKLPLSVLWFIPIGILYNLAHLARKLSAAAISYCSGSHFRGRISVLLSGSKYVQNYFSRSESALIIAVIGGLTPIAGYMVLSSLIPEVYQLNFLCIIAMTPVWLLAWNFACSRIKLLDSALGLLLPSSVCFSAILLSSSHAGCLIFAFVGFVWVSALTIFLWQTCHNARRFGQGAQIKEAFNLLLVTFGALWAMRGFLTPNLIGTGDARWYATMLQDIVLQARKNGLPIWTGASVYQFNGAIYPLRVAPAFHYLGALLDLATLRILPTITLLNLLLVLVGVAAALVTYLTAREILPGRRFSAALIALAYLTCPGVLGVSYNTDLYMSWMAMPCVTVVMLLFSRNATKPRYATTLLIALVLGLCWWGHSPIAIWTTAAVVFVQLFVICFMRLSGKEWMMLFLGSLAFIAVTAYPLGSVLFFPAEAGLKTTDFQRASATTIAEFIRRVFPAVLLPLERGLVLSNFQVGYGLWAILLCTILFCRNLLDLTGQAFAIVAIAIITLLLPIPGWHDGLWAFVPALVRNVTGNWAMNRLYVVLAASITVVFVRAVGVVSEKYYRYFIVLLVVATSWSIYEARKFVPSSSILNNGTAAPTALMRSENTMVTSFAYLLFSKVPDSFSHGVVAPDLEYRLLAEPNLAPIEDGKTTAESISKTIGVYDFVRASTGLQWIEIPAPIQIEHNKHYLLVLDAGSQGKVVTGVLQIYGSSLFREYLLPEYGGKRSFGMGGQHSMCIPIWTSVEQGEEIHIRFIPQGMNVEQVEDFAKVSILEYKPTEMPVQILDWMPFHAIVSTNEKCWFESPRMYQDGYIAVVNGFTAFVDKSPEGLAMVKVPKGTSIVDLRYVPPLGLRALFFVSTISIGIMTLALWAWRLRLLVRLH